MALIDDILSLVYRKGETFTKDEVIAKIIATGASFRGLANPSMNPGVQNTAGFWISVTPGVHPNFGSVTVNSNSLAIIAFDGSTYSITQTILSVADNSISTAKLINNAITPAKTSFFGPGKNLFNLNASDNDPGHYMDATGFYGTSSSYFLTGFIPVKASTWYYPSVVNRVVFFDANKSYISGIDGTRGLNNNAFQTPSNAAYIRASIQQNPPVNFQIEEGQVSTAYEAYKDVLMPAALPAIPESLLPLIERIKDGIVTQAKTNFIKNKGSGLTIDDGQKILQVGPENIMPQAITSDKISLLKPAKNLFNINASDNQIGYYVGTNGLPASNATYNATGFIPVKASTQYTVNYKHNVGFYDSNKNVISVDTTNPATLNKQITTPAGTAYVRCTADAINWSTFQIEEGPVGTAFEAYRLVLKLENGSPIYADAVTAALLQSLLDSVNSGLLVSTNQIRDGAVNYQKVAFLTPGKNKFNIGAPDNEPGHYMDASGFYGTNSAFYLTGFIPVKSSTWYYPSVVNRIVFFDSSKKYLSGIDATRGLGNNAFQTPANTAYIRASIPQNPPVNFQIEEGQVGTAYEPFSLVLNNPSVNIPIVANNITSSLLSSILAQVGQNIPDKSIAPAKTTFFTIGKNLFNPSDSDVKLGYYIIYSSGLPGSNPGYNATGFIPVKASTQYAISYKHQIAWYDANKVYISGSSSTDGNNIQTSPANAAYLRCSVPTGSWSVFQVEEGASLSAYEPYTWKIKTSDGIPVTIDGVSITGESLQSILQSYRERPATIAIAPKLYILAGREIAIYYDNIHKYEQEYKGKTDIVLANAKITGRAAKLVPSAPGTTTGNITVVNEKFDNILSKTFDVIAVDPNKTTPVKILNVGDSYTYRSTFINKLTALPGAANVQFLGIRRAAASTPANVRCEGRGGYSLATYVNSVSKNNTQFSPFWQPSGSYLFYGVTGFWKIVNSTGGYDWDLYTDVKGMFNTSTGYLITPKVNDVMYDDALSTFKVWDGAAWNTIAESTLAFTFNFGKYRQAWNIPQPDVLHLMLGTNDFASASETVISSNWAYWKAGLDVFINSVKSDSPNCKFIVAIPNSSGKQGNDGVMFYERRKRAYYIHAENIVKNYSGREAENLFVADYHSTIDREFGYDNADEKPFDNYTGTYRERYKSDPTHLGTDGFNTMADMYAALINGIAR